MISKEKREKGKRVGFQIINVKNGTTGWLAHVNQPSGPKVGKYRVNLRDLEKVGTGSIIEAVENADFIVIDEIGPMELHSRSFTEAVFKALESGKPVIGTIHWKTRGRLIQAIRENAEAEIVEVNERNRDKLHEVMVEKSLNALKA